MIDPERADVLTRVPGLDETAVVRRLHVKTRCEYEGRRFDTRNHVCILGPPAREIRVVGAGELVESGSGMT